jgi:hypothetical protein
MALLYAVFLFFCWYSVKELGYNIKHLFKQIEKLLAFFCIEGQGN